MQENSLETGKVSEQLDGNLVKIFKMMQAQNGLAITDKNMHFKSTELRMLSEIMSAQYKGERLISTKIADKLGITRSAVSQIVSKLEKEGVVRRVPDEVDRKIAYVEISEHVLVRFGEDISKYKVLLNEVISDFGEEKFEQMYQLFIAFTGLMQERMKKSKK